MMERVSMGNLMVQVKCEVCGVTNGKQAAVVWYRNAPAFAGRTSGYRCADHAQTGDYNPEFPRVPRN